MPEKETYAAFRPRIFRRFALFFLVWIILAEGRADGLAFGLAAALAATLIGRRLTPPDGWPLRSWRLLALAPHFLWQSFAGGVDVAWRVFHPALPLKPDWLVQPAKLPPGAPRVLLSSEITLWPGTVFAGVRRDCFLIHCLDTDQPVKEKIDAEEQRVARVFGDG
ncbi:MAG: Na+/H+ antiporter subunit E [Sphingomonadaceae bacterium]